MEFPQEIFPWKQHQITLGKRQWVSFILVRMTKADKTTQYEIRENIHRFVLFSIFFIFIAMEEFRENMNAREGSAKGDFHR